MKNLPLSSTEKKRLFNGSYSKNPEKADLIINQSRQFQNQPGFETGPIGIEKYPPSMP
jgi:hypothetical protein